jgi:hypothetical protein
MNMKRLAIIALLTIGFSSPALAADSRTAASAATPSQATESQAKAAEPVTHYDFEDDQVEGDLQRPDGELISSIPKAKESSLIEIRKNFIPEILKMIEDL